METMDVEQRAGARREAVIETAPSDARRIEKVERTIDEWTIDGRVSGSPGSSLRAKLHKTRERIALGGAGMNKAERRESLRPRSRPSRTRPRLPVQDSRGAHVGQATSCGPRRAFRPSLECATSGVERSSEWSSR